MTDKPQPHIWRRRLSRIAWGWVVLAVLWAGGFVCFYHYVATLTPPDSKLKTDAIVVLTGGGNRINTGLDMLQDGLAAKLLISGVGGGVTQNALVTLWRKDIKIPPCCITLGHKARNTAENATETQDWAAQENVHSIRLVTASYHMPRAWLEFHAAMPSVEFMLCPVITNSDENFLPLAFIEYNKTLLTWLRLYLWPVTEHD